MKPWLFQFIKYIGRVRRHQVAINFDDVYRNRVKISDWDYRNAEHECQKSALDMPSPGSSTVAKNGFFREKKTRHKLFIVPATEQNRIPYTFSVR